MNTKSSNKLNILLVAIISLLVFVACFNMFSQTNSWLKQDDKIGFKLNVGKINIVVKQNEREIVNDGYIYLNTQIIEADAEYELNVTITNNEDGEGYYIRCQAIAVVDGVAYNINDCITTDFVKNADGWMYNTDKSVEANYKPMTAGQTLTMMQKVKFSKSFVDTIQGQYVKLHLFVEGSATGIFS